MRNKRWWVLSVFLVMALLALNSTIFAMDSSQDRATLRDLKGVAVKVSVNPELEMAGMNMNTIQTDIELKLRMVGIKVYTLEESFRTSGKPCLYVSINGIKSDYVPSYSVSFEIRLFQEVCLTRNTKITSLANTWSVGWTGFVGEDKIFNIRDVVKDYVDKFINAYLSVNPKQ